MSSISMYLCFFSFAEWIIYILVNRLLILAHLSRLCWTLFINLSPFTQFLSLNQSINYITLVLFFYLIKSGGWNNIKGSVISFFEGVVCIEYSQCNSFLLSWNFSSILNARSGFFLRSKRRWNNKCKHIVSSNCKRLKN